MFAFVWYIKMQFKEFDPSAATNLSAALIVGTRSTGKPVLVKHLLRHLNCPHNVLVSETEEGIRLYGDEIPDENVYGQYKQAVVDDFIDRQKKVLKEKQEGVDPRACIVFEDCLFDNAWMKHIGMKILFMNGRCLKATHIMVMQYPWTIAPPMRANTDYIFLFKDNNQANRLRLYDMYAGGLFETFEAFCQAFDDITAEPHTCMVINNTAYSNRLEDVVMRYKAPYIAI